MRTFFVPLCILFLLAGWSIGGIAAPPDPQALMRDVTDNITSRLEAEPELRKDRAALVDLIETEVFPHVDFERVARLTLGRHWPQASATQQAQFVDAMKTVLACTYSAAFAAYSGQQVEYLDPRRSDDRDHVEIPVRIMSSGEPPIPVKYRLHRADNAWKVYDLVVEGVSLVTNYRSTFQQKLGEQDLDALISDLGKRSAETCKQER
ncbi:MAG: ABC transporter substrate-binding protein [Thiogranum sp.]|nr:ABC transporter substrate-binding protein [Thiogranum sp.]